MAVMLLGHGGWDVKGTPAYAKMPRGTTITFYTDNLRCLELGSAVEITSLSQVFQGAEANQTATEWQTIPNYSLSTFEPSIRAAFMQNLAQDVSPLWAGIDFPSDSRLCNGDGTSCNDGFHDCSGVLGLGEVVGQECYWIACRFVQLNEVGGAWLGVNQGVDGIGVGAPDDIDPSTAGLTDEGLQFWNDFAALDEDGRLQAWELLVDTDKSSLRYDETVGAWAQGAGV